MEMLPTVPEIATVQVGSYTPAQRFERTIKIRVVSAVFDHAASMRNRCPIALKYSPHLS
jgi:hypothetical protein